MGSPTSDDDPPRRGDPPVGWGPAAPGQGGVQYPGPTYPPPADRPRSNRGLVIALVIGLVILAGVAVALVYAFTRDEGDTVSAGLSTTTSAEPASALGTAPRTSDLLA